jgi:hypothetical protein
MNEENDRELEPAEEAIEELEDEALDRATGPKFACHFCCRRS